jgi:hypothetical protein
MNRIIAVQESACRQAGARMLIKEAMQETKKLFQLPALLM